MNPGDIISRYRIVGPLGKGGMGVVYRAEDTRLNRPVALKFLPSDSLTEQDKRRFLTEARAAAAARHPNICPIYDIEEADGEVFIVMACLDGETLHRRIARGPLAPAQAIDIAIQVAGGLERAHQLGIVHRDIKTSNIILSPTGHASILDFGLALVSGVTRLTTGGHAVGTAMYMSPEQAQGHPVDARTDVWALGVVLFEMLTGSLPFRRDQQVAVLHAILFDPVPPIPHVPAELQRVVEKALAKNPDHRWQSAHEFERELKRIQNPASAAAYPDAVPTQSLAAHALPARRKRMVIAAAGVLTLAAASLGGYRYWDARRTADRSAGVTLPVAPPARQVAVLPFQVIGNAESTRTVADGLVEILSAALSDFERFQGAITAVPSSAIRQQRIASPEEARRIYGTHLVITGSAQPAGNNVQLTLSLVDTATLKQVGAKSFVYDVRNPIASRTQAVDILVKLLNFDLTPAARTAITAGDTAAPDAYSAYLKGRGLLARYDVAGNVDKAIASFTDAVRQDPKYALAYAGLGEAYWQKNRATGSKEAAALALVNAEKAVQLDDSLAVVHSILGSIYKDAAREGDAIRELLKAIQLVPGNAEAPRQLAEIYSNAGRYDEAEKLYIQGAKARPTDWLGYMLLGFFYFQRERYSDAEAAMRQAKLLTPDNDLVCRIVASIYRAQGRYREAVEEVQHALKIRSNAVNYTALAGVYFYQHQFAEAVRAAEAALDINSTGYTYWGNAGIYYRWAPGNETKSAPALRRALELATKVLEGRRADFNLRANLAEYRARLGDARGALAEIDAIPVGARKAYTGRLALAYELSGHRAQAIELVRTSLTNPVSLNQIKDDPDLAGLWTDAKFQRAIQPITQGTSH